MVGSTKVICTIAILYRKEPESVEGEDGVDV
jgi:hypothetical protein